MREFVIISIEQMRAAFSKKDANGKGWIEGKAGRNEIVFDFPLAQNCTLRVWSSIRQDIGVSRGHGEDAIRVCAFNPLNDCGIVKAAIVQRISSWETNLRARIKEVASVARTRLANGFDGSRR